VVLLAGALGAELFTHEKVVDRVHNGVSQRQHIVVLNDKAPNFGDKETMSNWASLRGIESINHYYSIRSARGSFQGFSAWLTPENIKVLLGASIVKYVEEDEQISIDFTTEPQLLKAVTKVPANAQWRARKDWGQLRANNRGWTLDTTPNQVYRAPPGPAIYGAPYAPVTNWTWKDDKAYGTPSQGEACVIWVIDTGIYVRHDEFAELDKDGVPTGKSRVDLSVNFVATDNQTTDGNGHGTHCAGTAAGNYRGLATKSIIRSVRVLNNGGSGTWDAVIAGFNYVANSQTGMCNIASVSLGGGGNQAVDDAANNAVWAGVIAVIAAGNSNNNACGTGGIGGNSPARAEQAITVVAVDSADQVASFSSYGPCSNSCAPGVTVTSAWINPTTDTTSTDYYNDISGTSMATPHVAGAIATRPVNSDWRPDEVKADLGVDQTPNAVGGLTGVKGTTPNLYIHSQWKGPTY